MGEQHSPSSCCPLLRLLRLLRLLPHMLIHHFQSHHLQTELDQFGYW
jgi:hypothetical protein